MSARSIPRVGEFCSLAVGPLYALVTRAQFLSDTSRALRRFLGEPLEAHCELANLSPGTAVLHTDSSAWAVRLRFKTPEMLEFLRRQCGQPGLSRVKIRVRPPVLLPRPAGPSHRPALSGETYVLLREVAHSTDNNPRLQEALLRFSQRHRPGPAQA